MLRKTSLVGVLMVSLASPALAESSATLRGSRGSMIRQNQIAKEQDFTFLRSPSQVERFVETGHLVPLEGNADYRLAKVSFPYARPALKTFVERLAGQYVEGCGEQLVVTSLTRPTALQPGNAHELSVHPTGMAVDLRISEHAACREWLEGTLLSLEQNGLLDVTRERNPPHYHVAVFPDEYLAHVERQRVAEEKLAAVEASRPAPAAREGAGLLVSGGRTVPEATEDAGARRGAGSGVLILGTLLLAGVALLDRRRRNRDEA